MNAGAPLGVPLTGKAKFGGTDSAFNPVIVTATGVFVVFQNEHVGVCAVTVTGPDADVPHVRANA